MEKVLVTGGCGLIGRHICSGLLKKGYEVIAVDREESGYNEGKLHYSSVQCDPTDKNAIAEVFENNNFDILIHAACTVDNDLGPIVDDKQMTDSASIDRFIYRYAMTDNVKKVILLSTDQVYQFPKTREPIREDSDLKPVTNYARMKYSSEKALISELQHHRDEVLCCIVRFAPVYTKDFTDNLTSKITDPKDGTNFVFGEGQYGFQMCCVHNLVDFILCYLKNAEGKSSEGYYNVSDKLLTSASDIITFMRENHRLGAVIQRHPVGTIGKIKGLFGANKEERSNYRFLDFGKLENNNMLDNTRASKFASFRWDIHNTK